MPLRRELDGSSAGREPEEAAVRVVVAAGFGEREFAVKVPPGGLNEARQRGSAIAWSEAVERGEGARGRDLEDRAASGRTCGRGSIEVAVRSEQQARLRQRAIARVVERVEGRKRAPRRDPEHGSLVVRASQESHSVEVAVGTKP